MAMAYAYDDDDDKYGFGFDEAEDFEEDAVPCRCSMRGGARPSLHNLRLPSAALIVPVRKVTRATLLSMQGSFVYVPTAQSGRDNVTL